MKYPALDRSRLKTFDTCLQRFRPAIPFFVTLFATFLVGLVLFNDAIVSGLSTLIINIGLDPLRAQMIAALIMTSGAAFVGSICGRRKSAAILGGGIVFWIAYLASFIQLENGPVRDPGGHLEPLNVGALVHTSAVMGALGLLSAFIGAAVGVAFSQTLFDPILQLLKSLKGSVLPDTKISAKESISSTSHTQKVMRLVGAWASSFLMVVLLVFVSDASDLFIYSPDVGLHTPPIFSTPGVSKLPSRGTVVEDNLISPSLHWQKRSFLVYLPP